MTHLELLSPAGNAEALNAAVRGGADAVYLGLASFNARRNADNFTPDSLQTACDYAHLRGTRVYVALNTAILPSEVKSALQCASDAYEAGADALIIQDVSFAHAVSSAFPGCSVHLSTQANIHDSWGIRAAAYIGAKRVTLARELSLPEIANLSALAAEYDIQTEVFVHGALCVCYSGQCLMSSMIGARSANRGLCAQACRLPYKLLCEGEVVAENTGDYLLSPKDLCAADLLPELVSAGVTSFKIEGRMKSSEYAYEVTHVYRNVLDRIVLGEQAHTSAAEQHLLKSVFSRGFTTAYLEGKRDNDIMSYKRPNNRGVFVGRVSKIQDGVVQVLCEHDLHAGDVVEFWTGKGRTTQTLHADFVMNGKKAYIPIDDKSARVRISDRVFCVRNASAAFAPDIFKPRVPLNCSAELSQDKPLKINFCVSAPDSCEGVQRSIASRLLESSSPGKLCASAEGVTVQAARSKEITFDEVCEHIGRTGQTPFHVASFDVGIQSGVGIGFSQLHHTRSDALASLENTILSRYRFRKPFAVHPHFPQAALNNSTPSVCVLASNPECVRAAKRARANSVYVSVLNYRRGQSTYNGVLAKDVAQASYPKDCILQMPNISHDALGTSREAKLGVNLWEYVSADKPVLVESIAGLVRAVSLGAIPQAGFGMSITNALDLGFVAELGASKAWLSAELNIDQIAELAKSAPIPIGVKIAGAQELMVTEHCPLMVHGKCNQECLTCGRRMHAHTLLDRKDFEFPVVSDLFGRGHIYNSVSMDALPAIPKLIRAGVSMFFVDATLMSVEQTAQTVGRIVHALNHINSNIDAPQKMSGTTSGHMFRGVV
ncbi:DUF3656 domain-containing protein [Adlercreutzia sp. ZJ154]|uniref:DUF3656 domain-containing U32 family peptidase n=1 Tax=Adlercreutzia sp. ZJ154 TaxID=2709790 RepID=UPI0013EA53D9|nr:U32 family peptidase [Adlercreutzia sp. ZJ154]